MKVNITSLKKMTANYAPFLFIVHTQDFFPEYKNEEFSFWKDGEITVEGVISSNGHIMEAAGNIKVVLKCLCNACLEEITVKLHIPFHQKYQKIEREGNFENEPDEDDLNYYTGEEIDLKPLIREILILNQPLRQVCWEDCRGLCPECGTDLNTQNCGCADNKIDPRMSALEELLKK